jgi:acyl-CoA dehydrogenase
MPLPPRPPKAVVRASLTIVIIIMIVGLWRRGAQATAVDFELDPRLRTIQERARTVAAVVAPIAAEADASSNLDERLRRALAESDLAQLTVPAQYGGESPDVDPLAICIVREQLAAESSQLDALFALQGIGSYAIALAGSAEQRQAWLPRVASLDAIAALAITEPDAGSDVRSISSALSADSGAWVIHGNKAFISNGGAASFYTTLVREDDGFSLFLITADAPGLGVTASPELMAPHVLGDLKLTNVAVTAQDRIGRAGAGMDYMNATLSVFRASVGAAAVGVAQRALDLAVEHARSRRSFGKPLGAHGAVAAMLADSWTEIEMARLLVYQSAWLARADPLRALPRTSMAKLAATEIAGRVVDRSLQVLGRFGLIRGSDIERLYRQARPMRIYEGASEVLRASVARSLLKGND